MAGADRMTMEEVVRQVMEREHGDVVRAALEAVCRELMEGESARRPVGTISTASDVTDPRNENSKPQSSRGATARTRAAARVRLGCPGRAPIE